MPVRENLAMALFNAFGSSKKWQTDDSYNRLIEAYKWRFFLPMDKENSQKTSHVRELLKREMEKETENEVRKAFSAGGLDGVRGLMRKVCSVLGKEEALLLFGEIAPKFEFEMQRFLYLDCDGIGG